MFFFNILTFSIVQKPSFLPHSLGLHLFFNSPMLQSQRGTPNWFRTHYSQSFDVHSASYIVLSLNLNRTVPSKRIMINNESVPYCVSLYRVSVFLTAGSFSFASEHAGCVGPCFVDCVHNFQRNFLLLCWSNHARKNGIKGIMSPRLGGVIFFELVRRYHTWRKHMRLSR